MEIPYRIGRRDRAKERRRGESRDETQTEDQGAISLSTQHSHLSDRYLVYLSARFTRICPSGPRISVRTEGREADRSVRLLGYSIFPGCLFANKSKRLILRVGTSEWMTE